LAKSFNFISLTLRSGFFQARFQLPLSCENALNTFQLALLMQAMLLEMLMAYMILHTRPRLRPRLLKMQWMRLPNAKWLTINTHLSRQSDSSRQNVPHDKCIRCGIGIGKWQIIWSKSYENYSIVPKELIPICDVAAV